MIRSLADFNQTIKLNPDFAGAYYDRGIAYRLEGDKQSTIQDFKRILQLIKNPALRKEIEQFLKEMGVH